MTSKRIAMAVIALMTIGGSALAQEADAPAPKVRNYFVKTSNVKEVPKTVGASGSDAAEGAAAPAEEEQADFISRNFRYISMCNWEKGMRFMVKPTREDLVLKIFADANTGNMVSTRKLENSVLIYDGHDDNDGGLHEKVFFHVDGNPSARYYFEVPTGKFDDYCYSRVGVPGLAYLGEVDLAQDTLVGRKVRILDRWYYQDSDVASGGYTQVDLGDARRGSVMTITKVGVGNRNYPTKIIFKESDTEERKGQEYFQFVTISRTNCGFREEDFGLDRVKPHLFKNTFQLMDDKMAVSPELRTWVGKTVYTFFDTTMRDKNEKTTSIGRLSTFVVDDIYRLGDTNEVTLTLRDTISGNVFRKEVTTSPTRVTGKEEILSELFIEGNPADLKGIREANLPLIRKQQVKKGFTEAEVLLALGEPTEKTRVVGNVYRWVYQYKDNLNRDFREVKFSRTTRRVIQDMTR